MARIRIAIERKVVLHTTVPCTDEGERVLKKVFGPKKPKDERCVSTTVGCRDGRLAVQSFCPDQAASDRFASRWGRKLNRADLWAGAESKSVVTAVEDRWFEANGVLAGRRKRS